MARLMMLVLSTVGSGVGWWLGARFGIMTAFLLSMVGTGFGLYWGNRLGRDHFG